MVLCLPCGDGAAMAALRARGMASVGIDTDPGNVAGCRARGLVAWPVSWRDLGGHRQRFDGVVADAVALGIVGEDGLAELLAALAVTALPGAVLLLLGVGEPDRALALLPADLAPAGSLGPALVLRRAARARPLAVGLPVAAYADLFTGCGRALELGAGTGRFVDALHLRDLDACGLEQDGRLAAAARARGLDVRHGGLEAVRDHAAAFGGVFAGNVVEALDGDGLAGLLAAARHALRPGGRLVVRAARAGRALALLQELAPAHGFPTCRRATPPGDAHDDVLVALAGDAAPALPAGLERVRMPTAALPIAQPPRSLFDLERCERRVSSQGGEDGVLEAIFARIGTTDRHCVEFGCGDGVQCNTAHLRQQGWTGLLMDGAAAPGDAGAAIHAAWITAENIEGLLDAHAVPSAPDLMSIDLDGNDYWVWRAIRRRPRVVIVEYNANLGCDEALTIPYDPGHRWDGTDFYGASLPALARLGRERGYTLVYCTQAGVNAFFVRDDVLAADGAGEAPPPLAAIYRPPNYWYRGARQPPDLSRAMVRL